MEALEHRSPAADSPSDRVWKSAFALASLAAALLAACAQGGEQERTAERVATRTCRGPVDVPVRLAGGSFRMGQEGTYREEAPVRTVSVGAFWIDPYEVTNRQFAQFVAATNYITTAERPVDPAQYGVPADRIPPEFLEPGSAVFSPPAAPSSDPSTWWRYIPGANWRKPRGPNGPDAAQNEPVVHLARDDMLAYARWRGGRLPTEAEWEYAAAAGAPPSTEQPPEANSWQGLFPVHDEGRDGFVGLAPVGCYQPNAFGVYDMVGNVWEMTLDSYTPSGGGAAAPLQTIKGGSYLCAPNYCRRYRPAARQGQDPGLGSSHVGFRLVYDRAPSR